MEREINWEECPIGQECLRHKVASDLNDEYIKTQINDLKKSHAEIVNDTKVIKDKVDKLSETTTRLSTKITFWGFIFSTVAAAASTILIQIIIEHFSK